MLSPCPISRKCALSSLPVVLLPELSLSVSSADDGSLLSDTVVLSDTVCSVLSAAVVLSDMVGSSLSEELSSPGDDSVTAVPVIFSALLSGDEFTSFAEQPDNIIRASTSAVIFFFVLSLPFL